MTEEQVVKALAALAHPLRLQVFRALVVTGPAGLTPGVMQEAPGVPATTLSFHLKALASSGLVTFARASRSLVYQAAYASMNCWSTTWAFKSATRLSPGKGWRC